MDRMGLHIGLDVGSVSLNTVLIDPQKDILEERYTRTKGQPQETVLRVLTDVLTRFPAERIQSVSVTGTGGKLIAELLAAEFVNEVIAQSKSTIHFHRGVKTVIEMGGEDSKLILVQSDPANGDYRIEDFSMNTICAAGTGSFLDQQANRLHYTIEEFSQLALKSKTPPRIAGRCSVFAKSDMIHLQQGATPDYDIVAGLCYALARNFKSNIGKGKKIITPVAFQGGVAANAGMRKAFFDVLELKEGELIIPKYFASMGAIGAAFLTMENPEKWKKFQGLDHLRDYVSRPVKPDVALEALTLSEPHKKETPWEPLQGAAGDGKIPAYLGIDVGSISTNVVVMDENKRVLSKRYLMTAGRPIEAIRQGLKEVGEEVGHRVEIKGVCTTGSGRYLTGDFVGADVIRNEITAQATAAAHIDPRVDTIFEIGGQDSKYISLEQGAIVDFEMNKACAAGTGSFLEEQAEKLGISIKGEFGKLALSSQSPVSLGERCTVFMESDLVHHQQKGAKRADLVAGLSYSIVINYLNKVVGDKRVGDNIFFRGGTAFNQGVVAAFEKVTGKKITVPEHNEVTGAIGCCLLAMEENKSGKTHFKGWDLSNRPYQLTSFECKECPNHCEIRRVTVEGEKPLFYGTERGNPGNRKHVILAEVRLPSEVLRLGFHFIDTPGVGSTIAANTATTHGFLPEADAVVFVTSFESAMSESELVFLRTVARHVRKIFFVVNKADLVSAEDSKAVLASVRRMISADLDGAAPQLFALSARDGLEAKLTGNWAMLARSGLPELESALTHFLTSERASVVLLRCIERTIALLTPECVQSRASDVRASLSGEAARPMKREWERRMEQIETECLRVVEALQHRIRSELPPRFEHAIAEHCAEVRDRLAANVDDFLLRRQDRPSMSQGLREIADRAQDIADERRCKWLSAHQVEFEEVLWTLSGEGVSQLERLNREALEFAAQFFRLSPPAARWTICKDETMFSWKVATPFAWHPRLAWELDLLPAKWVRRRVRRDYRQTLEAAAIAYGDRVAQALAEAGNEWAGSLGSEMRDALRNLRVPVSAVMEGQGASSASGEGAVLLNRLERMREEFMVKDRDNPATAVPLTAGRSRAIHPCFVCERIATELFDFFSKRQYKLSMNEAEQHFHAANGGFCSLHTWQYENIASPQGVCLAYAPLLAATARRLRSIASSALSSGSMRDGIRALYPSVDRCPACRRTAEAEETAVEELRQVLVEGEDGETDTGLCIRHLGTVLNRETGLEIARALLFGEARTLDRTSEDMQTYSLKHDAVQRELVGDEERKAYLFGLFLLAGHRRLSGA